MDMGGSFFEHDSAGPAQLFGDMIEQDFNAPFGQPAGLPPSSTKPVNAGYRPAFGKTNARTQETSSQQNSHHLDAHAPASSSSIHISKRPAATVINAGSLKQILAQVTRSLASLQALEDRLTAWSTRVETRLQSLDSRLQIVEADSRRTQDSLQMCLDEIGGAIDYMQGRQGPLGGDHKSTDLLADSSVQGAVLH